MTEYPWLHTYLQQLQAYIIQQRPPQAILITGNPGLGKHILALQFAKSLLCMQRDNQGAACGACRSCILIAADSHPDYFFIAPVEDSKTITIEQIRLLTRDLSLKPYYESYRVVIINPADLMNTKAANAFLKYLEEPTERTVLILISAAAAKLPATIISRCQQLPLQTPPTDQTVRWLAKQGVTNDVRVLIRLAQGAPLLAQQYAQQNLIDSRKTCFEQWLAVAKHQQHPLEVAEVWLKQAPLPLMVWIISWLSDLIKCHYSISSKGLSNPDFQPAFQGLVTTASLSSLYLHYDRLLPARQLLDTQVNKQILWEEILIQWSEINRSNNNG